MDVFLTQIIIDSLINQILNNFISLTNLSNEDLFKSSNGFLLNLINKPNWIKWSAENDHELENFSLIHFLLSKSNCETKKENVSHQSINWSSHVSYSVKNKKYQYHFEPIILDLEVAQYQLLIGLLFPCTNSRIQIIVNQDDSIEVFEKTQSILRDFLEHLRLNCTKIENARVFNSEFIPLHYRFSSYSLWLTYIRNIFR